MSHSSRRRMLVATVLACGLSTAAMAGTLDRVLDINERGQILGIYGTRYRVWENGATTDLGIESTEPYAYPQGLLNAQGQVVGTRFCPGPPSPLMEAFLWDRGNAVDLDVDCQLQSSPVAINARGQVLWNVGAPGGPAHPMLWENGVRRDIEVEGAVGSFALDFNNQGQIVGWINEAGAFLWDNGTTTRLGPDGSYAIGINNRGQVLVLAGDERSSFLWEDGVITDLGPFRASSLNERGQVVGWMLEGPGAVHAFLWDHGVFTDLGTLPGHTISNAFLVNDPGTVLGQSQKSLVGGRRHVFLWRNGVMTDLGNLGGEDAYPIDMNERGQVIGSSKTATGENHAFLWEHGTMTDLSVPAAPQLADHPEWNLERHRTSISPRSTAMRWPASGFFDSMITFDGRP